VTAQKRSYTSAPDLTLAETMRASAEVCRRRARGEEKPVPVPWPSVAREIGGGLWPGCHVLVGNTGTGKTQFALQLALHAAEQGVPVRYVGFDLDQVAHDEVAAPKGRTI
jgi:predicted ATP-dependent serine protease